MVIVEMNKFEMSENVKMRFIPKMSKPVDKSRNT